LPNQETFFRVSLAKTQLPRHNPSPTPGTVTNRSDRVCTKINQITIFVHTLEGLRAVKRMTTILASCPNHNAKGP
ncbi:hypothetical protein, partial [Pseudomonas syringae group genomosp. 3]|uniref:hypothetical protein n=1 Tax=Pseudomonas syringae group genomosp. 3 TaxID=251701 RepID=UPI001C120372